MICLRPCQSDGLFETTGGMVKFHPGEFRQKAGYPE